MTIEISKFKNYLLNLILIWLAVILYRKFSYYANFLRPETQTTILYLAIAYTTLAFFYYLFISKEKIQESKGAIIFDALKRIVKTRSLRLYKRERTSILFILVKIFFLPIMLNFFFNNLFYLKGGLNILKDPLSLLSIRDFNFTLFPIMLGAIFLLDTLWFSFGYAFEAGFLKNKIRSVEPTLLGWLVALACYPPFNSIVTQYTNWYANEYIILNSLFLTTSIKVAIVFFLIIYLAATFALGTKCSNLTNRGIVSKWPYSMIRHPAYISKNLVWWFTVIPIATLPAILSMATWSLIYHLRSITEEKHLNQDPDYIQYCKKVKYRYIPGIY